MAPESSYRRGRLAPRCRLITSWLWRGFQGFVCSPIKVVRELGLERRETVRSLSAAGEGVRGLHGRTRGARATKLWSAGCRLAGQAATLGGANRWERLKREALLQAPGSGPAGQAEGKSAAGVGWDRFTSGRASIPPQGSGAGAPWPGSLGGLVEFDYGSGRMRARRLTHASRAPGRGRPRGALHETLYGRAGSSCEEARWPRPGGLVGD